MDERLGVGFVCDRKAPPNGGGDVGGGFGFGFCGGFREEWRWEQEAAEWDFRER